MSSVLILTCSSVVLLLGCLSTLVVGAFIMTHTKEFPVSVRLGAAFTSVVALGGIFLASQLMQLETRLQMEGW